MSNSMSSATCWILLWPLVMITAPVNVALCISIILLLSWPAYLLIWWCDAARHGKDCWFQNVHHRSQPSVSFHDRRCEFLGHADLHAMRSSQMVKQWLQWRTSEESSSKSSETTRTDMSLELDWSENVSDSGGRKRFRPMFNSSLMPLVPRPIGKLPTFVVTFLLLSISHVTDIGNWVCTWCIIRLLVKVVIIGC